MNESCNAAYVDMLLLNNFMPTVTIPTRIMPKSATLVDHIYYYEGNKVKQNIKLESGNFLGDLSDHLPDYNLITNANAGGRNRRPLVRIFSNKNKQNFSTILQSAKRNGICSENDINTAYDNFMKIVADAYDQSFSNTKLSRDKPWIMKALKKSSKVENNRYKKWLSAPTPEHEEEYKK